MDKLADNISQRYYQLSEKKMITIFIQTPSFWIYSEEDSK